MAGDAKIQIYNLACRQGLITPEQHQECVVAQQALEKAGRNSSLLSIAAHKGYITREQIKVLQAATGEFPQLTPSQGGQAIPAPEPAAETKSIDQPQAIEGYEIASTLGKGGFGVVYLATQLSLNRPVAIKILPSELAKNEIFVQRFFREAQTAGKLVHPNVVQVLDVGQSNGCYFIVMEYVPGATIDQQIKRSGALPEKQVLDIGASVAKALQAASKYDLVHRDIKPGNLMRSENGVVKLADFGIAREREDTSVTQAARIIGTPDYMSPEQAQGKPVDVRSDLYSLGATLYHCATGRTPFQGATAQGVLLQQVQDKPVPPKERNPAISDALNRLIVRLLEKDPAHRLQTPESLIDAIGKVQSEPDPDALSNEKDKEDQYLTIDADASIPEALPVGEEAYDEEFEEPRGFESLLKIGVSGLVGAAVVSLIMVILSRQPAQTPLEPSPVPEAASIPVVQVAGPPEEPSSLQWDWIVQLQEEGKQIDAYMAANPKQHESAIDRLNAFKDLALGSGLETITSSKIERLKVRQAEVARENYTDASRSAALLIEKGNFGDAISEYQKLQSGTLTEELVQEIEKQIQNIQGLAEKAWEAEKAKARGLANSGDPQGALRALQELTNTGVATIDRDRQNELKKHRAALASANDKLYAAAREKLTKVEKTALLYARQMKFDQAAKTMSGALEDEEMKLLGDEIEVQVTEFEEMGRVLKALFEGAESSKGKLFKVGGVNGTIKGVRDGKVVITAGVAEMAFDAIRLSTSQVVELASRALSDTEPNDQIALGLFLMLKLDFSGALTRFNAAAELGADVSKYLKRIEKEGTGISQPTSQTQPTNDPKPKDEKEKKITIDDVFGGRAIEKSNGLIQISYSFSSDKQLEDFNSPLPRTGSKLVAQGGFSRYMTHIAPFEHTVAIDLRISDCEGIFFRAGASAGGGYSTSRSQYFYAYQQDGGDAYGYLYPFGGSRDGVSYPFGGTISNWSNQSTNILYQRTGNRVLFKVNGRTLYEGIDPIGSPRFAGHMSIGNNGRAMEIDSLAIVGKVDKKWLEDRMKKAEEEQ
ncbi:MAG: protein kinase [Planctomycetota bacterium]|nr:protein kinase [Planctomycetota bacterium]MDA1141608.1 protein kinase [Planctomycetota bacterium]